MAPRICSMPPPAQALRGLALARRVAGAGPAVEAIVQRALALVGPRRVWLFGSRARDDAATLSDIDLAFEGGDPRGASALRAWVDEEAPTLLDVDLVDLDRADRTLRDAVQREGILLYERPG